jgi:hypothetical protein
VGTFCFEFKRIAGVDSHHRTLIHSRSIWLLLTSKFLRGLKKLSAASILLCSQHGRYTCNECKLCKGIRLRRNCFVDADYGHLNYI